MEADQFRSETEKKLFLSSEFYFGRFWENEAYFAELQQKMFSFHVYRPHNMLISHNWPSVAFCCVGPDAASHHLSKVERLLLKVF